MDEEKLREGSFEGKDLAFVVNELKELRGLIKRHLKVYDCLPLFKDIVEEEKMMQRYDRVIKLLEYLDSQVKRQR